MMGLPWHDWQFWVVTAAALWGVWRFLSPLLPRRQEAGAAPCGGCAAGAAACARKPQAQDATLVAIGSAGHSRE